MITDRILGWKKIKTVWMWLAIPGVAAAFKFWLLIKNVVPFNADEAVVALMARHILQGERPIFFYGQAYMGSLDAYLVALSFRIFGESVSSIRYVQIGLYLLTIITSIRLSQVVFKSRNAGWLTGMLLAIPTVNMSLYTTASLGGYGEALLIGSLILLVGWRAAELLQARGSRSKITLALLALGFLSGLGLWANALCLVYSVPAVVLVGIRVVQNKQARQTLLAFGLLLIGGIAGAFPWIGYALSNGPQALIGELLGGAVAVEQGSQWLVIANHLVSFVLLGIPVTFGLRAPWNVDWLVLPLIPLVVIAWLGVYWGARAEARKKGPAPYWFIAGAAIMVTIGFLLTSFGVDPSGRYFLPVTHVLAILAGGALIAEDLKPALRYSGAGILLVYALLGNVQCVLQNPPGLTTQFYEPARVDMTDMPDLIEFLSENEITSGYSNYWVAYPLAFLSAEELIFTPTLPYHLDLGYTARDNRYPAYNAIVAQNPAPALITTRNELLDRRLIEQLETLGVTWKIEVIGDFHVYYNLSAKVYPAQLLSDPGQDY